MEKGQRTQRAEEIETAGAGNPDIQVPKSLKREEGLRGAQRKKRTPRGETRRVRTKETAEKMRGSSTHTLGKEDHLSPEATPRWDRTVPRSPISATSLEGRG
ncbi:hypothetical protein NDU88_002577 [Pleurodeles waltl]|uniref:Uncharacterized protein n=1 Tax=Pleurodeles waltl TaxID=8319 RepID=A0AAV7NGU0_PLEWA|nr:hypothetical protein NDU88_002577 [Pleurodeles waltl]